MSTGDGDDALIRVETPGAGVAVVTLDRPAKRNALSIALRDELVEVLDQLAADDTVRAVVLTGAGGTFSAGFDLGEFELAMSDPSVDARLWSSSDRYHQRLLYFPLPLIAAVNGPALGGGMDTAVLCDLRIASSSATFGHPEAKFGDVVYAPLHDLIGGAAARDLCLTGRTVDAAEALRLGLLSETTDPEHLMQRAVEIAGDIATTPRHLLMRTKAKIIARTAIAFAATRDL